MTVCLGPTHRDGTVDAECWCHRFTVRVTYDEVKAGLTRPCRSAWCRAVHAATLAERTIR